VGCKDVRGRGGELLGRHRRVCLNPGSLALTVDYESPDGMRGHSFVLTRVASPEAAAAAARDPVPLRPAILEVAGAEVEAQIRSLAGFEAGAAGMIAEGCDLWMSHCFLQPGAPSRGLSSAFGERDTAEAAWLAEGGAERIAIRLRTFCAAQAALVERQVRPRLDAAWAAIEAQLPGLRQHLRFHAIFTVRRDNRDTEMAGNAPHADTFDGTMCCFALTSNKVGTPVFPAAEFAVLQGEVDHALLTNGGGKREGKSDEEKAEAAKKARGKQLRDLQAFFMKEENDPKGDFSGLRRVLSPDGSCLGATDADLEALRRRIEGEAESEVAASWGR
jgi:hypothetical protein